VVEVIELVLSKNALELAEENTTTYFLRNGWSASFMVA